MTKSNCLIPNYQTIIRGEKIDFLRENCQIDLPVDANNLPSKIIIGNVLTIRWPRIPVFFNQNCYSFRQFNCIWCRVIACRLRLDNGCVAKWVVLFTGDVANSNKMMSNWYILFIMESTRLLGDFDQISGDWPTWWVLVDATDECCDAQMWICNFNEWRPLSKWPLQFSCFG